MALVAVSVKPNSRNPGIVVAAREIEVRVAAPARDGAANDAVRRTLAEALGLPLAKVRLKRGAASRTKVFEVAGLERGEVEARLRRRGEG